MPALKGAQMASNHVVDGAWCPGCGLHIAIRGAHRPDCTVEPSAVMCAADECDEIRLPSQKRPVWSFDPKTGEYHCPTHQKGTP